MNWILQHLAATTGLFMLVAVLIALMVFRYLRQAYGHESRTQFESVLVGLAVTVLFSVILNHLYAEKRQWESRLWAIEDQHFAQLKQVLRGEAETLHGISETLKQSGQAMDYRLEPAAAREQFRIELWRDVMSEDLQNHFPQYNDLKKALAADLENHTEKFRFAVLNLRPQLKAPGLNEYWRETDALSYVLQCIGHGNGVTLNVSGSSFTLSYVGGSTGGSGSPSPDQLAAYEAFRSLKPKKDQQATCRALKADAEELAKQADQLSKKALLLAQETVLRGECQFIKLDF